MLSREQIETRMGQLRQELQTANDELGKLRPRVQYLEQTMLRLDGALTVLGELLDAPGIPQNGQETVWQPAAS